MRVWSPCYSSLLRAHAGLADTQAGGGLLKIQSCLCCPLMMSIAALSALAGQLNGGNNLLNPYVNGNVNASSVAQQLVSGASAAGQLAT